MSSNNVSFTKVLRIAAPLILQRLSYQVQTWVDRAMLGHVDSGYFSAIGNVLVPYHAVSAVISAMCCGTTIIIAHSIGANNKEKARGYAECSYIGNSLFPIIAFLFFFFFSGFLFEIMGVQSPILEYAVSYMRIISISLLVMGPVSTSTSIMQGMGITKVIMLTGIISNIINVVLDWLLIFGNLGFPALGIEGAAIATVIGNLVTAPIPVVYVFKSKRITLGLTIKSALKFRWSMYKNVLKIGVPSGFEYFLWNLANFVIMTFLNRIDMISPGIYSLILGIENLPLVLYMGFANASLTLVGQKTGAGAHDEAIKIGFRCLRFAVITCTVIATVFILVPEGILSIFTDDTALISYATGFFILTALKMFPKSVNNVIGLSIRGLGDTKWMLYSQIIGAVLVIGLSYILIFLAGLGLWGIFITMLVDETIRGVVNLLRFWKGREVFGFKPFMRITSD